MAQTSEKWKVQCGKNLHILNGNEVSLILNAGDARFVKLRGLVINPAFIADMVLIESANEGLIEAPDEKDLDGDEWLEKHI